MLFFRRSSVSGMFMLCCVALASIATTHATYTQPIGVRSVSLTPGSQFAVMEARNLDYLINLNSSRLTCLYMSAANLSGTFTNPLCVPYAHPWYWGHYLGHWLSATALTYGSTQNETLLEKMSAVVDNMAEAQAAWTAVGETGYLFPYDTSSWVQLANATNCAPVCVPFYVMHKMIAGLLEQYTYTYNQKALNIVVGMAGWVKQFIDGIFARGGQEQWQQVLSIEWGGMNEALYNLYSITQNPDHLKTAYYFNHFVWTAPLAIDVDNLSGNHANTHIPEVIGDSRGYELTGNVTQLNIVENFFKIITTAHSFSTGGSNDHEYWGDAHKLGDQMDTQTEESCTTYNMLKLARHLYQWTGNSSLFDFYERALYNGLIGNQNRLSPYDEASHSTGFIYMLPLGGGGISKQWGPSNDGFPCCWGTLSETFSKLGDSIYSESTDGSQLYVNLFASSAVNWESKNVTITQDAGFPSSLDSTTTITIAEGSANFTLNIRVPYWATNAIKMTLNGSPIQGSVNPGTYFSISRQWSPKDVVDVYFEASIRFEQINDDRDEWQGVGTVMYGGILLAGVTNTDRLPGDHTQLNTWIKRNSTTELTFAADTPCGAMTMLPLFDIMFEQYAVYFHMNVSTTTVGYNETGTVLPGQGIDMEVSAGAGIVANGDDLNIRSGDPDEMTSATWSLLVQDASHTVSGFSFDFQYVTGYGPDGQGSNFSLTTSTLCGGNTTVLWTSDELTQYRFDDCNTCYSPVVHVKMTGLTLNVTTPTSFGFEFQNNDRNLQLLLPINLVVIWND